ncbi:MAG: response regulator [Candidatus Margulisbacteria bacterium]|nr:response regulator [Candidatus Margulisiibacteriota bacterium]
MMAKILVVDDAIFTRKLLSDILKKEGHEIIGEAENAAEAVKKYQSLKPDIVTMDIIMPETEGMNGIGAVKAIIKIDKEAKIIMVSAMGQQEMIVEAIQAGAKDFIVKPFQPSNVINAVNKLLKR